MSAWTLRSAWNSSPRHAWAMQVARCSECKKRVGTWLEEMESGHLWAKPCGCRQTACLLPEPSWELAADGMSLRWRSRYIPLQHADGRVS